MPPAIRNSIYQEDYSAGMVRDVAPHLIPSDGAYDIQNGLLNEDGSVYRRGGSVNKSGAAFGSGLTFTWDGYMTVGRRTLIANSADFGVLDSNDSTVVNLGNAGLPYPAGAAYLKGMLFLGGGFIYGGSRKTANYTTGTVETVDGDATLIGTGTTWTTNIDAGMIIQIGTTSERVYVVASVTDNTHLELTEPYDGSSAAGRSYAAYPVYQIVTADPYPDSEAYTVAFNRLVAIDPATGQGIVYSEINAPHDFTNKFGTNNEHDFPEGNVVLGLAVVGALLLAFTTGGVWAVSGMALDIVDNDGNPLHRKEMLSRDIILWGNNAGISTWGQMLVVPTTTGVYLIDGVSQPLLLSQPITPLYEYYVERSYRPGGAAIHKNHLMLPILGLSTNAVADFLVCRLSRRDTDHKRKSGFPWTHFKGTLPAALAVRPPTSTVDQVLLGATPDATARVVDCNAYFEPTAATKNDADGTNHEWAVITRDYETGNLTLNVVRKLVTRYVLEDAATDNPELNMAWSDGTGSSAANWGENNWNSFNWASNLATYYNLSPNGPEATDTEVHKQRVNKRVRYIRFRVRNTQPAAAIILRSQEIRVRPSQATRR